MNKLVSVMNERFSPKMNKFAKNPWIAAMQESIMAVMPVIFVGSIITILSILAEYIPSFPDLSLISSFTFGLTSLFLSFMIPQTLMEKLNHQRIKKQAGMVGTAFFLIIIYPVFDEGGNIILAFESLGAGGMLGVIISSLLVGVVLNLFAKFSFFKEDTSMPDFITVWFDTLIPIFLIVFVGWLLVFQFDLNIFDLMYRMLTPLLAIGQSYWGFMLFYLIGCILFSFGISIWLVYPLMTAVHLQGMAENITNAAAGAEVTAINTSEVLCGFLGLGGHGTTLALCLMMAALAKSKRLKVIGRTTLVPSVFNINEPLIFGAPIAFNPMLMIPFWISGIVLPTIVYFAFKIGFTPIPDSTFLLWYMPVGVQAWMVNQSLTGLLLVAIVFAVSWLIYYPFFKVYDNQLLKEEA